MPGGPPLPRRGLPVGMEGGDVTYDTAHAAGESMYDDLPGGGADYSAGAYEEENPYGEGYHSETPSVPSTSLSCTQPRPVHSSLN